MDIEKVAIKDLTPDPENARTHDTSNLKAIAGSLELFGQRKPIVITIDGIIMAGNGTVQAAKQLGWTHIDATRLPADWTPDKAKAYALADNRTAELADWDPKILADQLIDLDSVGWDVSAFGFNEINPLIDPSEEDDTPLTFDETTPAITKPGDVYQLGRHRLMCGDSTVITDVDTLTGDVVCDMAFTDPPYGVSYTGGLQFKSDGQVVKDNRDMIKNDDVNIYAEVMPILASKVDGPCYIWFAGTKASDLYESVEQLGDIHALIIWVKNGGYGALNANYKQKHEPCLYWKPNGSTLRFTGATTETTVWQIDKDGRNLLHPTQKPVALAQKAIANHEATTVLDLFGGSGSTLIASEMLGRTCYMMELDPKYCDVIVKRWEDYTGQKATLMPPSDMS